MAARLDTAHLAIAGFILLPRLQPELKYADLWDAICSAAGVRNIARAMTSEEIDEAAAFYASQPPEIVKATD